MKIKNEKVYIEGYIVGVFTNTLEKIGNKIQLANGDIVDIDNRFVHKFIKPEKVKVPQFVADWIEEARKSCKDVADLFDFDFTNEEVGKWFMQERPFDLVTRAWLDGYEVEKEKRYTIRFKNIRKEKRYLKYDRVVENWYFGVEQCSKETKISHTRTELEEAGFGWVFDCEGIEIEEVD